MRILIDNALTHTPPGTAITVQTKAIDAGNPADRTASLTVTDDGPGIDAHSRERVFERFFTGDEVSAPGSALRSVASWRCGWAARSSCVPGAGAPSSSCGSRPCGRGHEPRTSATLRRCAPCSRRSCSRPAATAVTTRRSPKARPRSTTATEASEDGQAQNVVIEAEDGAFDAHAIYQAASPGVVTSSRSSTPSRRSEHLQRRRWRRRPGLGIRHLRRRRDPHQRPRRHRRGVDRHHRPSAPRGRRDLRPVRRPQPGRGRGRRLRSVRRRRAAQGRSRRPRPAPAAARLRERRRGRGRRRRDRQPVRPEPVALGRAWSPPPTARSTRSPTSRSTAASRPTPRSTRATPAARCSTPTARSSASTSRSRPPRAATRASASPFRSTSPSARSTSFARTAAVSYAYAGVTTHPLYPQLAERLDLPVDTGALCRAGRARRPRRRGRAARRRRDDHLPGPAGRHRRRRDHRRQRRAGRRQRRPAADRLAPQSGRRRHPRHHSRRRRGSRSI